MNMLAGVLVTQVAREYSQSALPDAPTVPAREPTPRIPATRRAMASGLRWAARRIEPRVSVAC